MESTKEIRFGFSPGPYRDLVEQAVKPGLEQKGYKVSIVQFQDWVQRDHRGGRGQLCHRGGLEALRCPRA